MDFVDLTKIQVNFNDLAATSLPHREFIETVLIDQRDPAISLIYQLLQSTHELKETRQKHIRLKDDYFILIGHLHSLDKQKKTLTLSNQNTISYDHLIIAKDYHGSGEHDFIAGLQALIDALKLKDTISFQLNKKSGQKKSPERISSSSVVKEDSRIKLPHLNHSTLASNDGLLERNSKRFFEIHV